MKKILLLILVFFTISCEKNNREFIDISIAASLIDVVSSIAKEYEEDTGIKVNINSAGSGTLKKQIENGAHADFIFFASKTYVDDLVSEGVVERSIDLLNNRLVLLGGESLEELKKVEKSKKMIVIGDPGYVPAGRYAKEVFENLGIWNNEKSNILFTKDVRSALTYYEQGEVDYAIVYVTDLDSNFEGRNVLIDDSLHSSITYSAGVVRNSPKGKEFYRFVLKNIDRFEEYGFKVNKDAY